MQAFLESFSNFWIAYGPWIGASLIPTIIVGLTVSPKTAKAASWVRKIWDVLKVILDYVSVLTHKDKPGTFKLPFKSSNKTPAEPLLILLLVASIASSQIACGGWWKENKGELKQAAIDCTIESVRSSSSNLVPGIYGILLGEAVNWREQISTFSKSFGKEAVACAVQTALQRFRDPIMSEPEEDPVGIAKAGAIKASLYLDEQGVKFVE